MHTQVHSQSFWCVAVEADRQELRHFFANSHTSSPIATLVLDQNKLNYFTSNIWVQHIRRTALLKLAEVSRTLWETWFGFNKWSLANIILIWINTDFIINMNVIHKSLGLVRLWFLFFPKEMDTFIQQECIQLFESDSKDIYATKDLNKKNAVLLKFLFIKESCKNLIQLFLLSTKSAYWNDFWKIIWHWRLVMATENTALPSQIVFFIY